MPVNGSEPAGDAVASVAAVDSELTAVGVGVAVAPVFAFEFEFEIDEQSWLLYAWQVELPDASAVLGAIKANAATTPAIRVMRPLGCLMPPGPPGATCSAF